MPGKWTTAVEKCPELFGPLLANASHGLSPHIPPRSPQNKKQLLNMVGAADTVFVHSENMQGNDHREGQRRSNRKGHGTTSVIQDLYVNNILKCCVPCADAAAACSHLHFVHFSSHSFVCV